MSKHLLILVFAVLITSCVPHKKLVYFQGEPIPKEDIYKINEIPYKLQVNDIISITIRSKDEELVALFRNEDPNTPGQGDGGNAYFNGYSVDGHGNVRLPYIGELNVLGYTTDEVREKIKSELRKYIVTPHGTFVTVKLNGIRYTIIGEISSPGTNVLYQNKVNIIEAISNSGDVLDTGDRTNIEVLRDEFDGLKKYTVDITQVTVFDSEVFNILPHDIIYVKPIKTKSWGIGTTGLQTFTTLASIFSIIATTILLIQSL